MKYQAPSKCFFRLPNEIFNLRLDPFSFEIYAYLVCCAGSRGECWPSIETMHRKLGISISTIQDRIRYLKKRKFISISKQTRRGIYKNNVYTLLSLDNPEIYRDPWSPSDPPLEELEELPLL